MPKGGACYVGVDLAGRLALTASYGTGSVAAFPLDADGMPGEATFVETHVGDGPDTSRQSGPHAHALCAAPGGRFAVSADLGTDRVDVYRIDGQTLVNAGGVDLPAGTGPRHIAFSPDGRHAYVSGELASSVVTLAWDAAAGVMKFVATQSTLTSDFRGENAPSEIAMHPGGKFLYVANRGQDALAVFAVDNATGELTLVGHDSVGGHWAASLRDRSDGGVGDRRERAIELASEFPHRSDFGATITRRRGARAGDSGRASCTRDEARRI